MDAKIQCTTFGFKQETPQMANCVMTVMQQAKIENRWRNEIMGNAISDAGKSFQNSIRSRRSLHCSSNQIGTYTSTNCY